VHHCFNPCFGGFFSKTVYQKEKNKFSKTSFNPCFGGFFSKTQPPKNSCAKIQGVSILVLVDFSLKLGEIDYLEHQQARFQSLFWWIFL